MSGNATLRATPPVATPATPGAADRAVRRIVDRLLADYPVYFPGAATRPALRSLRLMSRRLSDVARVELQVGARVDALYVKLHKHRSSTPERVLEKAHREFATLSDLHARMAVFAGCRVARPVAFFPEETAVVTAEVHGENLHQAIKTGVRRWSSPSRVERLAAWCEGSGVWLRHFQEITDQAAPAPVPADTLLTHIDRLLDACGPVGVPAGERAAIVDFCRRRLDQVRTSAFPVVGAHPDFQPDNIVVGPDGITVLDFTSFRHSPPCSDLARFIATLEFLAKHPLYDPGALRALGAAFLRGYGARDPALEGVLAVYVLRYVLLAATTLAELRASALVQSAIHQRLRRFLTTWCRQFLATGGTHVLPILASAAR